MNRWKRTKYEGVFIDARAEARGNPAKFVYKVEWHGRQIMRGGFVSAAMAKDNRFKTRVMLVQNDGKLPYHRLPSDSFKKMVDALVRKGDVRKTFSKTGKTRYSIFFSNGNDYALFNLCFRFLAESKKNYFKDGATVAQFAAWVRKTGLSERTLEMAVRLLNKTYGFAVARGLFTGNPVKDAKQSEVLAYQIKKKPGNARRYPAMRRMLTDDDKGKIYAAVLRWRDPRSVWVGLNVWMGLRPSVFNRIRFEDFDPSAGLLYVRPEVHKSRFFREAGRPSASILRREVYPLLEHYAAKIGIRFGRTGFVDEAGNGITGLFIRRPYGRSVMRRQWQLILRAAGVEYAAPYAARHTVINELLSSEVPVQDVATHSGNSPETIFRYYVRPSSDADIRRAAIKWQGLKAVM